MSLPSGPCPEPGAGENTSGSARRRDIAALATPAEVVGRVDRIVYANAAAPFTVARVRPNDGELTTVVGQIEAPRLDISYRFVGEWTNHADYGRQLRAHWYEEVLPTTAKGIEKYLASGLVKGVGKGLARRIVKQLGPDALNIIEQSPDRLAEVPRLGPEVRTRILAALEENRATRRIMTFLSSHDITPGLAQKIYRAFGTRCIEAIKQNPYRMADEIFGVNFKISDSVARRLGLPPDAPFRLRAGVLHALRQAEDEGHMYLPRDVLLERAEHLLEVTSEQLEDPLASAEATGRVVVEDERVYLRHQLRLEDSIAMNVAERGRMRGRIEPSPAQIEQIERRLGGIRLAALQRECLRRSLSSGVFIMTGGPGTGKTTTVRSLLQWCGILGLEVQLAAPTGRAARRLAEASGAEARTLHRLLEYSPQERAFTRNAERTLQTDVVIVDEASMIDAWLFAALLDALPADAHLVLVGDVDQLPSVGAGCVLRDLIGSERVPVEFLDQIFRQGEGSLIIRNSHRINHGEMPEKHSADSDFFFIEEDDPKLVAETIIALCAVRLPHKYGFNPVSDIQVLAPMYKGDAGVINLNNALQERLNPPLGDDDDNAPVSNGYARVGDKVMQLRNNYEKCVFNGDMGIVTAIDEEKRSLAIRLLGATEPVSYSFDEANELVLAYACSVHKSQGSEFQAAVIPLTTQHYIMLQRNLLYTAVTRARKLVVLVGSRRALAMAIKNDKVEKRYTYLAEKVRKHCQSPTDTYEKGNSVHRGS